ncbi:MAG: hypothetical protein ABIS50_03575 [Luteolibacter sp.]|uniref:hypothetical protein n=1 Tax=Luteolibacter sp. TaxID=1962973 RepID=UPI0032666138
MIPWVVVLVVSFTLNAFCPDHAVARKSESRRQTELSQCDDNLQSPGRLTSPMDLLPPLPYVVAEHAGHYLLLPRIEALGDEPTAIAPAGAVQGRAPPVA